jgi:S-adenosylmethionine hydrolase
VTLLTDFGERDGYAGILKGVILARCPNAQLVDLTHEIEPQDIMGGAFILANAVSAFPHGTIHLAVVDPGVGSERRPVVTRTRDFVLVGPDNGLLSLAAPSADGGRTYHLDRKRYFAPSVSGTFHGRDIFAPVAGHLAAGVPVSRVGTRIGDPVELAWPAPSRTRTGMTGEVVWIDRFGNLVTNFTREDLDDFRTKALFVSIRRMRIPGVSDSYAAVPVGRPVALWNSSGRLEVALRDGSAAHRLKAVRGDRVEIKLRSPRR